MKTKKKMKKSSSKMKLDDNTNEEIIDILKNHLDKMEVGYQAKDNELSKKIYERLVSAHKESRKIHHECSSATDIKLQQSLQSSNFFPEEVIEHIHDTLHFQYHVKFEYKNIDFTIRLYFEGLCRVDHYIDYIKWIICLCLINVSNETKETMTVDFFMTSLKKGVSHDFNQVIQPIHVNSGFSSLGGEMYIRVYRKEEWMKVFIHECFHAFNMDFHEERLNFKNIFHHIFHIDSDFLVFESFVEFWAKILNCALFTYQLKPQMTLSQFYDIFALNLNIERIHSLLQASKILKLFDLTYSDVVNEEKKAICKTIYKEETNSFCYYVITAVLMNFFDKTLQWFDVHNVDLFQFDKNERHVLIFCYYIRQIANNKKLIDLMDELSEIVDIKTDHSMKLSLFEIQLK